MNRRILKLQSVACALLVLFTAGCAGRYTGPWNLRELYQPPAVDWQDDAGSARALYYANEPYAGHPTRVFAWYAAPQAHSGKLPGVVLVHGGGGKAFAEWAELWAQRGYAAIAMDLAGRGPDGEPLPDGGPDQGHPQKFGDIAKDLRHAWPYHAVAAVIRAHSLLRSLPEVDPDRTAITGISWGGYLTCIVSGLDDRFKAAVPVYGCGFLDVDSPWIPMLDTLTPADRQLWLDNYDPSRYLPGVSMSILFVNGTNDFAYPPTIWQQSHHLVRGPKTLCMKVRMPHSHPEGWAPVEIGIFVDSLLSGGEPLPKLGTLERTGRQVRAVLETRTVISHADLHYTVDQGEWKLREWHTAPARLEDGRVAAELPREHGIVWYLSVTDERGALSATDFEQVPP